jgi:deoxyribodipyrimidine photolyase
LDCIEELRDRLKAVGSGLLVYYDKPENVIPKLISKNKYTTVVYSREICPDEIKVEKILQRVVKKAD